MWGSNTRFLALTLVLALGLAATCNGLALALGRIRVVAPGLDSRCKLLARSGQSLVIFSNFRWLFGIYGLIIASILRCTIWVLLIILVLKAIILLVAVILMGLLSGRHVGLYIVVLVALVNGLAMGVPGAPL